MMQDFLVRTVSQFFKEFCRFDRPVLLGFSGGPDSLALFHALIDYRKVNPSFVFALAHVDHGWRVESLQEAEIIASIAKKYHLSLHLKRLNPDEMKGNLEAACRDARLEFFSELSVSHGYQAVVLGHHADDLAETVLKKTLEGCSLSRLGGMGLEVSLGSMKLWRPFLKVRKQEILKWLKKRGLQGFQDATNEDPRFLRARFRNRILPSLALEFGKEISPVLCRLSDESHELRTYLDHQVKKYLDQILYHSFGFLLDLTIDHPFEIVEIKHMIRSFCEIANLTISRDALNTATTIFLEGSINKQINQGKRSLHIDRHRLFIHH